MFSSKSFIVSGLTLGLSSILRLSLCMVLESVPVSFFYMLLSSFLAPFIQEAFFAPLYILASFVKNKVPIAAWVSFQAFYLVLLVYISVFVPVPYCLDDYSFVI